MTLRYELTEDAYSDLFEIWRHISHDGVELADRIEAELYDLFDSLGGMPRLGRARPDLTNRPYLFFPLYSYMVVYRPETIPIRIVAILRSKRNVRRILRKR